MNFYWEKKAVVFPPPFAKQKKTEFWMNESPMNFPSEKTVPAAYY